METGTILSLIGIVWVLLDILNFELGKRGILNRIKDNRFFRKRYKIFHSKMKKIIHKRTFITVLFAKLSFGLTTIALMYLGTHIPRKKFYPSIILVNMIVIGIIALLVYFVGFSFASVWEKFRLFQKEVLIIIVSIIIFFILEDLISKKLES